MQCNQTSYQHSSWLVANGPSVRAKACEGEEGEPPDLGGSHQLGGLSNALLDVAALLVGDGGVHGGTLVGHQDPEHVPDDPKDPWVEHQAR